MDPLFEQVADEKIAVGQFNSSDAASSEVAAQSALYERIQDFSIDVEGDDLAFSQRVAADNGWPIKFALEVIEEYKRFAFLAVTADHPVTPSDQVDQVWHLHLAYTHSYWDEFCPQILQTSLHHTPTRGGEAETKKFEDWYAQTLESYERYFDETPPEEIWPPVAIRFNPNNAFLRVNTRQIWTIPKLPIQREVLGGILAVLSFGIGLWVVIDSDSSLNPVGGILVSVMGAIASYSLIQFLAGFLDALNRPVTAGGFMSGCGVPGGPGCG